MARLIHIAAFAGLAALSAAGGAVATIGLLAPDLLRARLASGPVPPAPGPALAALPHTEPAPAQALAVEAWLPAGAPDPVAPDLSVFGALRHPVAEAAPAPRIASLATALPVAAQSASPFEAVAQSFARAPVSEDALPPPTGPSALDGPEESPTGARLAAEAAAAAEQAAIEAERPRPTGAIIVLDASEGTPLDPLRQKNWDLNAVQVIPALQATRR